MRECRTSMAGRAGIAHWRFGAIWPLRLMVSKLWSWTMIHSAGAIHWHKPSALFQGRFMSLVLPLHRDQAKASNPIHSTCFLMASCWIQSVQAEDSSRHHFGISTALQSRRRLQIQTFYFAKQARMARAYCWM